jgi:2,4-diaminopentanoate dehydrogenase
VHGSGLNPGNLSGVLPLALSGMSRSIDRITLQERADWSVYESTGITFDNMAFGQTGLRDYGDTAADTQAHRIRQRLGARRDR